ncbi:MAG TPA: hypothetical protein VNC62_16500, partial [Burkholderiales bacterium]|nr:hypothetical protein [Burkholderiales bacterium]
PESERFAFDTISQILDAIPIEEPATALHARVCIVPARDEADELAGAMLARVLPGARLLSAESLAGETLEQIDKDGCTTICVSAVPPHAASHAAYLTRRLKKRFPKLRIVVGLWSSEAGERIKSRLTAAGVDEVATRLDEAVSHLRQTS